MSIGPAESTQQAAAGTPPSAAGAAFPRPVRIAAASAPDSELDSLVRHAAQCVGDPASSLELARKLTQTSPRLNSGGFLAQWEVLATLGAVDLGVARCIEPHLDALNILTEAGSALAHQPELAWGVYAAEGAGHQLQASQRNGTDWVLEGSKPWCSLAETLPHAIITAAVDGGRRAFAVDLTQDAVTTIGPAWVGIGLAEVPSRALRLSGARAEPIGATNWYLDRPGFAWGGVGVAAVWHGAMVALARALFTHCTSRTPDAIALMHLGMADTAIQRSVAALRTAAEDFHSTVAPQITAARARAVVVQSVETVLDISAHGMGPAPLAFSPEHAKRVADLSLYLRQDHGERSLVGLGTLLVEAGKQPW